MKQDVLELIDEYIESIQNNFPRTHDDEVKINLLIDLRSDINGMIENGTIKQSGKLEWTYNKLGNYWCASRDYGDDCCSFIYCIHRVNGGYIADASNNAYGACRVAVKNERCKKESIFNDLEKLMMDIANGDMLWLYVSHCSCIGKITKEEY
jgi:hypothetical protein